MTRDQIFAEIRKFIREGHKTSVIIAETRFPMELVKQIKGEEFTLELKARREKEKTDQQEYLQRKKEMHHRNFLKRVGVDPDKPEGRPIPIYGQEAEG